MFVFSYPQSNVPWYRQHRDHHSAGHDDSSFQITFGNPATDVHFTAVPSYDDSLPPPPPGWTSSHHWYRHRHRVSNERLAVKRVADWLNLIDHDDTEMPLGELDRHHDRPTLVVHEHRCHRYYLHR